MREGCSQAPGAENKTETRRKRTEPGTNPVGSGMRPRTQLASGLPAMSAVGDACICPGFPRPALWLPAGSKSFPRLGTRHENAR